MPFLHFFDGFRTSHEVNKIEQLTDDDLPGDDRRRSWSQAHRERALTPDRPVLRGTAQNPDVFFQAREACNPLLRRLPGIVQKAMDQFAELTGRQYHLFDYVGAPDAERVIVLMGSGAETRRRDGRAPRRARARRSAWSRSASTGRSTPRHFVAALPEDGQDDRRAGPHQGAGRRRRAALPGRRHRARARLARRARCRPHAAGHRRPLRPVVQGVHAGDGQGGLRRAGQGRRRRTTSPSASTTTSPTLVLDYDPDFATEADDVVRGRVLRPRRRRHGRRQQELDQDHRRGDRQLRPGLLRLRLEEGRRGDRLAPALRPASRSARPT